VGNYSNGEIMHRLFTQHPATVGENYFQHMYSASSFGARMLVAAFCCFIHAIFPFMFEKSAGKMITGLYDRMIINRHRSPASPDLASSKT
jgi:Family of unknown function (DUF6356)